MAPQTVVSASTTARPRRSGLATMPAIAGLAYVAAWVIGLAVAPSSTDVHSTGAQVITAFAGHRAAAAAQFLLTEGAASIALAVVAIAVGRAGVRAEPAVRPGWRSARPWPRRALRCCSARWVCTWPFR